MPNTRRPTRRPAGRPADKNAEKRINWQLVQLLACLVILGAVLLVRAFQPEAVQAFVFEHIQGGIELEDAFAQIGEGFKSIFVRVPSPDEGEADATPNPDEGVPASPEPSPEDGAAADEPGADGQDADEPADPAVSPSPVLQGDFQLLAMGGFDEPLRLPEEYLPISDELEEDDTLPLPFGVEKPEKADYGVYELPFDTTLPLDGTLTSRFGYRMHPIDGVMGFHYGLDIAAPQGTEIVAYADGTVIAAGDSASYGKYLMIRHDGDYITLYAHCSRLTAREGSAVRGGESVAEVGSTGKATGPHLHFEIRRGNSLLNPEYYLDIEV